MSRNAIAIVSSLLFAILAALLVLIPVPYVAWRPGQTIDVLASTDRGPVIEVKGLTTYETGGRLLMTTVSTTRVDSTLSLPEAIFVYLGQDTDAMPREIIYPPGKTSEQVQGEAVAQMDTSRTNATVAALRADGVQVDERPVVESIVLSGPSAEKLMTGDLVLAVDDKPVALKDEVDQAILSHAVGDSIAFTVLRDGREISVTVVAAASNADARRPVVGANFAMGFEFAPQVSFGVDPAVTGPSAGLIFALGIYDRITEGAMIPADRIVAGTGTIDTNGKVGRIGAVREKIKGAERDGATVFLVPSGNCGDIGDLRTSVQLVRVDALQDAIHALALINEGNTAEVPTCD